MSNMVLFCALLHFKLFVFSSLSDAIQYNLMLLLVNNPFVLGSQKNKIAHNRGIGFTRVIVRTFVRSLGVVNYAQQRGTFFSFSC